VLYWQWDVRVHAPNIRRGAVLDFSPMKGDPEVHPCTGHTLLGRLTDGRAINGSILCWVPQWILIDFQGVQWSFDEAHTPPDGVVARCTAAADHSPIVRA